jgi:hypothetical protein
MLFAREMRVHRCTIAPSDGNIYKYMSRAFKRIYSISCFAIILDKQIIAKTYGLTLVFNF